MGDVERLGLDAIFPALLPRPARGRTACWWAGDRRGADRGGALASPGPVGPAGRAGDRRLRRGAPRTEGAVLVTALWITIVAVALANAATKAAGPILVGGRELPPSANAIIALLAPALLAALVVTETFGEDGRLILDVEGRLVGVAVERPRRPQGSGAPGGRPRRPGHRACSGRSPRVSELHERTLL